MKTVLLIDDEYFFRQAIKKYFSDFSSEFEICGEANNGKDGFQKILELKPDIALVDITMPQMDGIEVIREALCQNSITKMIILTGYSEFEYAQKALRLGVQDYLLKPIQKENLYQCLVKISERIDREAAERDHSKQLQAEKSHMAPVWREHLIQKLLKKGTDWQEIKRIAQEIPFDLNRSNYCVVLCDIYIQTPGLWAEEDLHLCNYSAANILSELFTANMECLTGTDENKTLYFLLGADGKTKDCCDLIHSALEEFLCIVNQHLKFSVLLCAGSFYPSAEFLERSYQEAKALEKYQILHRARGIHFYSDSAFLGGVVYIFPNQQRRKLHVLMHQNDTDGVKTMISEIFQKMKSLALRPDIVYMQTSDIISCAFEFATQNHVFSEKVRIDSNLLSLPDSFESIDQLYEHTLSYIFRIMERTHMAGQTSCNNSLIYQILQFIEKNYASPGLNLDEISSHFYISRQHLCYLFKREYNMTIGDFLLQTRMEHAKELFDGFCENVSLVALKCGYEDASYFSKCFKQYYGISPKPYLASRER